MRIPILSRLGFTEYLNVLAVLVTLTIETVIRFFVIFLPNGFFDYLQGIKPKRYRHDIEYFCEVDYHYTTTKDEYILCVHRLTPSKIVNGEGQRPVILLWHGAMMNSEVFVCSIEENSLAKYLQSLGYDVWIGNTRGNKYSKKHLRYSTESEEYWNFSLDEIINYDIPATVDYVLSATGQAKLTYIGFSQGTATMFAALAINPTLQSKVDKMIALAAIIKPNKLRETIPAALIQSSPQMLYLLFGRKSMLSMAAFWAKTLDPKLYSKILDISMGILFGWTGDKINNTEKLTLYRHLYSTTSVKAVVHWFQIIGSREFQFYSDGQDDFSKQPKYPIERINTNIYAVLGTKDTIADKEYLLSKLKNCKLLELTDYEHLDVIWGSDVRKEVFPFIHDALKSK